MKIFISNFDEEATVATIAELFLEFGPVSAVRLREGQKRTYAIVEMLYAQHGEEAIRKLDGKLCGQQCLDVKESNW